MSAIERGIEQQPKIDFLNPDIRIALQLAPRAVHDLPEVMDGDENKGGMPRSRYAVFAGRVIIESSGAVKVRIEATCELDEAERNVRYASHGADATTRLSIIDLKSRVDSMDLRSPESDMRLQLLGDIHTHAEGEGADTTLLAQDIAELAAEYQSGALDGSRPFIFAVGTQRIDARDQSISEPDYAFYRLVRTSGGTYTAERLE